MFDSQRLAASPQLPADEDVGPSAGRTSLNQQEAHSRATQEQRQLRVETHGCELQQLMGHSLQHGMFMNEFLLSLFLSLC